MQQLQDVRADIALLLQTGTGILTDEIERLRSHATVDRAELARLTERAHTAETDAAVLKERAGGATGQRLFRDGILALAGILAGVGFAWWLRNPEDPSGAFGLVVFAVGLALIVATVFLQGRGAAK